jgi:hypothetical protein
MAWQAPSKIAIGAVSHQRRAELLFLQTDSPAMPFDSGLSRVEVYRGLSLSAKKASLIPAVAPDGT